MIPERFGSTRRFYSTARRMVRELLVCVALPSVLLVGASVVAQNANPSQSQRSDEQIATDINNKIQASDVLRPLNLGVWVHDGIATLSGTVPRPELRQQAASLVQSVPGIKSVDDQITIGTAAANSAGAPQEGPGMPPPPPTQAEQNAQGNYPATGLPVRMALPRKATNGTAALPLIIQRRVSSRW